jgi:very-short-patch-repair endonuclease
MRKSPQAIRGPVDALPKLPRTAVAGFVLGRVEGSVVALGGIDSEGLRAILDAVEPGGCDRRALFARFAPAPTAEAITEQAINLLAETARRLWPIWFGNVSFAECRDDRLGRSAAISIVSRVAKEIPGLLPSWAEAASLRALANRLPRVNGMHPAQELAQLALAVSRFGLVLVADMSVYCERLDAAVAVHALEWIARHGGAVVALFPDLPPNEPPVDRILYGARCVSTASITEAGGIESGAAEAERAAAWIAPWRGMPHPLSDIEQRLANALGADTELAPLFGFNQSIDTILGSRPKVDLLWKEGRLIVELDGYGSHGNRTAFMYDRHRDYELTLSGYTVLRLANDEITQDIEKSLEKIRDLVHFCRTRTVGGKT